MLRIDFDLERPLALVSSNLDVEARSADIPKPYILIKNQDVPEDRKETAVSLEQYFTYNDSDTETSLVFKNETKLPARSMICLYLPRNEEQKLRVETHSASLSLRDLCGELTAEAKNGKISLKRLKGSLKVSCANGSVNGKSVEGDLDISCANGRVVLKETAVRNGIIKSARGRVFVQVRPAAEGSLSIYAGNGRVKLGLPPEGNYTITCKTQDRLLNGLEGYTAQTQNETSVLRKGEGGYAVFIQNNAGGIHLLNYNDFENLDFEDLFDGVRENFEGAGQFFENIFNHGGGGPHRNQGNQNHDFSEEFQRFIRGLGGIGEKLGQAGEEFSREFKNGPWNRDPNREEVLLVLNMLKENKISVEEAGRLIEALSRGRRK